MAPLFQLVVLLLSISISTCIADQAFGGLGGEQESISYHTANNSSSSVYSHRKEHCPLPSYAGAGIVYNLVLCSENVNKYVGELVKAAVRIRRVERDDTPITVMTSRQCRGYLVGLPKKPPPRRLTTSLEGEEDDIDMIELADSYDEEGEEGDKGNSGVGNSRELRTKSRVGGKKPRKLPPRSHVPPRPASPGANRAKGRRTMDQLESLCVEVREINLPGGGMPNLPTSREKMQKSVSTWWWRYLANEQIPYRVAAILDMDALPCYGFEQATDYLLGGHADVISTEAPMAFGNCQEAHVGVSIPQAFMKHYTGFIERNLGFLAVNMDTMRPVFTRAKQVFLDQITHGLPIVGDQCAWREALFHATKMGDWPEVLQVGGGKPLREVIIPPEVGCRAPSPSMPHPSCKAGCLMVHNHQAFNEIIQEKDWYGPLNHWEGSPVP